MKLPLTPETVAHFLSQSNCESVTIEYTYQGKKHKNVETEAYPLQFFVDFGGEGGAEMTSITPTLTELEPVEVGEMVWVDGEVGRVAIDTISVEVAPSYPILYVELNNGECKYYHRHELLKLPSEGE